MVARQILNDGARNLVVRWAGLLEDGDILLQPALELEDCQTRDDGMGALVGFRCDELHYSISDGLVVNLTWNSLTQELIAPLAGSNKMGRPQRWAGLVPDRTLEGYDGSINLQTYGAQPATPASFTIEAHFVKLYQQ